ncbi:MAG: hypothetical protein Q4D38_02080 [Planctomycetia bacterium]|nr:hypothetical protein [Planctomycetia bacterium]
MNRKTPQKRRGVLTFEWILIFVLLTIGIVGGLAAVRDATILKFADSAEALAAVNAGYSVEEFKKEFTLPDNTTTVTVSAPAMSHESDTVTIEVKAGAAATTSKTTTFP